MVAGGYGLVLCQGGVAHQRIGRAHCQELDPPAGTQRQGGHQVTVAGIVALADQHTDAARLRPAAAQGAPGGVGGAPHQFETGSSGGDQARVEVPHLSGGVERNGQVVARSKHRIRLGQ
ncbi:hypothetical protein D9M69_666810 [compost metagenome]